MASGGATKQHFAGHQQVATVDALEAFVAAAAPEARFIYCEAPAPMRGDATWQRAGELAQAGLVSTHQERRQGGGWTFFVRRTRYKPALGADPVRTALADAATAAIFRELKRAANLGLPCPPDTKLAAHAGLNTRDQAQWRFRKLIDVGLIESTLAYEGGIPNRVVTVRPGPHAGVAAGKQTALPKKWAALQAAAARDARSMPGPDAAAERDAGGAR